ncbi:MAG: hypothetical protein EWM73_01512 [Nitrospira sp.]|nr:MAG: hypothetical protein EWM73_01512 [Nitrospira sp.]
MKCDLALSSIRNRPPNRCRNSLLICPVLLLDTGGQLPLSQGKHRRYRTFASLFQLSFVALHSKLGQGKLTMGIRKTQGNLFIAIVM